MRRLRVPGEGLALRLAVFAAGLGFMLSTLSATDTELKRRGHGVNFAAIPEKDGLATDGPFSWSRNPIYAAGMLALLPAVPACLLLHDLAGPFSPPAPLV